MEGESLIEAGLPVNDTEGGPKDGDRFGPKDGDRLGDNLVGPKEGDRLGERDLRDLFSFLNFSFWYNSAQSCGFRRKKDCLGLVGKRGFLPLATSCRYKIAQSLVSSLF